jgi:hypothetical protein
MRLLITSELNVEFPEAGITRYFVIYYYQYQRSTVYKK